MTQRRSPPKPEREFTWVLFGCEVSLLKDTERIVHALKRSLQKARIDTYGGHSYKFLEGGEGVTAVEIVGASCADIHTWPEHASAVVRCFACGDKDVQVKDFVQHMLTYTSCEEAYEVPERIFYVEKPEIIPPTWILVSPLAQSA